MSYLWLVIIWVAALVVTLALAVRSGEAYSPQDAEEHATEYGGTIREAHGPITLFLWVCYGVALVFIVAYTIVRWSDVVEMFRAMGL